MAFTENYVVPHMTNCYFPHLAVQPINFAFPKHSGKNAATLHVGVRFHKSTWSPVEYTNDRIYGETLEMQRERIKCKIGACNFNSSSTQYMNLVSYYASLFQFLEPQYDYDNR